MKNIDVLVFIEHKDREMDGTIKFVEKLAMENSYKIAIANIEFGFWDAFFRYNPKVVCLPYGNGITNHMANAFYARNNTTVFLNMNYEQIFNPTTMIYKRPADDFAKKTMMHLAWGENFKEYLTDNGVIENRITVTGKPEIYFLKELHENSDGLKEKLASEFGLNRTKKWVFIPLNDGTAFLDAEQIKADINRGLRNPGSLLSHNVSRKQVYTLLEYIPEYLKGNNDTEIILRPHPGVSINEYSDLMENELKIKEEYQPHIIRDYSVKEWLCCSDVCISNWSTVMLDASAIGVPTFVIQPEKLPDSMNAPWIEVFRKIKTYNDFVFAIDENDEETVSNSYIDRYIDTTKNPIIEIANYIDRLIKNNTKFKKEVKSFGPFFKEWKHILRSKVRLIAHRTLIFRKFLNKKISYDFFEEIYYD